MAPSSPSPDSMSLNLIRSTRLLADLKHRLPPDAKAGRSGPHSREPDQRVDWRRVRRAPEKMVRSWDRISARLRRCDNSSRTHTSSLKCLRRGGHMRRTAWFAAMTVAIACGGGADPASDSAENPARATLAPSQPEILLWRASVSSYPRWTHSPGHASWAPIASDAFGSTATQAV